MEEKMGMDVDFLSVFYGENDRDNFTCQLFRLIAKSDVENRMRIGRGFPREVNLYEWWMRQDSPPAPIAPRVSRRARGSPPWIRGPEFVLNVYRESSSHVQTLIITAPSSPNKSPRRFFIMPRKFAGASYDPALDDKRLEKQLGRVYDVMIIGAWMTLAEIESRTGDPQASISAQLRHLRKPHFGGYILNRRHRGDPARGLYEYQLLRPPTPEGQIDLPLGG